MASQFPAGLVLVLSALIGSTPWDATPASSAPTLQPPPAAPPNEVVVHAGYDPAGGSWSVRARYGEPLVVVGPRTLTPAIRPLPDSLSLRAALDGDTLWISDFSSRVVAVSLLDGSARAIELPVAPISEIAARGGVLYASYSRGEAVGLLRADPATLKSERVFEGRAHGTLLALGIGPSRAWIVTWTGLMPPRVRVDLTGIPLRASADPPRRATREVDWAAERWSGFSVQEDEGGNVWLAHTYAGRVERLDPAGTWRSWPVSPERLAGLALSGSRAVALVARMAPENPSAPPEFGRATLSHALLLLDPAVGEAARTPIGAGTRVEALRAVKGRLWIAAGREVALVAGRAVIREAK